MLPRGIRNNNPGNIRLSKTVWHGQSARQSDPSFVTFDNMAYGVRAIAKLLITYHEAYGLDNIEGLINRWAPPIENVTSAYVKAVSADSGYSSGEVLDLNRPITQTLLIKAITIHENGGNFVTQADLWNGVAMALFNVEPSGSKSTSAPSTSGP